MYSSFVRLWAMNSTQQKNILLRRRRNLFWDCIVGGPFLSSTILVILRSVVEDLFSPGKVETSDTSRKLSKVRSSFWILLSALFSGIFSNSAIVQNLHHMVIGLFVRGVAVASDQTAQRRNSNGPSIHVFVAKCFNWRPLSVKRILSDKRPGSKCGTQLNLLVFSSSIDVSKAFCYWNTKRCLTYQNVLHWLVKSLFQLIFSVMIRLEIFHANPKLRLNVLSSYQNVEKNHSMVQLIVFIPILVSLIIQEKFKHSLFFSLEYPCIGRSWAYTFSSVSFDK